MAVEGELKTLSCEGNHYHRKYMKRGEQAAWRGRSERRKKKHMGRKRRVGPKKSAFNKPEGFLWQQPAVGGKRVGTAGAGNSS